MSNNNWNVLLHQSVIQGTPIYCRYIGLLEIHMGVISTILLYWLTSHINGSPSSPERLVRPESGTLLFCTEWPTILMKCHCQLNQAISTNCEGKYLLEMLAIRWLVVRISAAYSGQVEPMFVLAKDNIDFLYLFVWRQVDKDYIIRCIYKDSWPFCVPYLVWYNYAKNSIITCRWAWGFNRNKFTTC